MGMKVAIIMNPISGNLNWEGKLKRAQLASRRFERLFYNIKVDKIFDVPTTSKEEFCSQIKEVSEKCEYLLVGGGCGTAGNAFSNIYKNCTLGYIPLGSGNSLERALFLHRLNKGKRFIESDVLVDEFDEKRCLYIGAGIDGFFINESNKYKEKGWKGTSRYFPSILNIGRSKETDLEIKIDGCSYGVKSAKMIYIGKHPIIAGVFPFLPEAKFDDGLFHCKILNKWYYPTDVIKGNKIDIEFSDEQYVQRDGDIAGKRKSLNVYVEKKAVKLLTAKL